MIAFHPFWSQAWVHAQEGEEHLAPLDPVFPRMHHAGLSLVLALLFFAQYFPYFVLDPRRRVRRTVYTLDGRNDPELRRNAVHPGGPFSMGIFPQLPGAVCHIVRHLSSLQSVKNVREKVPCVLKAFARRILCLDGSSWWPSHDDTKHSARSLVKEHSSSSHVTTTPHVFCNRRLQTESILLHMVSLFATSALYCLKTLNEPSVPRTRKASTAHKMKASGAVGREMCSQSSKRSSLQLVGAPSWRQRNCSNRYTHPSHKAVTTSKGVIMETDSARSAVFCSERNSIHTVHGGSASK